MSDHQDEKLTGHEYDGIQELDNPLPNWWLITFLASIFFAFIYYVHYEFNFGPSLDKELEASMAKIESLKASQKKAPIDSKKLQALLGDEAALAKGKEVFDGKCAVCHGNELQGLIGPNLTDKFWLHGKGKIKEVYKVVEVGVVEKGMPAWEGILDFNETASVSAYIVSKIGSNPTNAKSPEGEPVE